MDLLGGYGSSDDDEDSNSNPLESNGAKTASTTSTGTTAKAENKRGKKILSLSAVLPQHILNQLTQGISDSEDEDDAPRTSGRLPTRSQNDDTDLKSFLSDLQAAPTTGLFTKKPSKQQPSTPWKVSVMETEAQKPQADTDPSPAASPAVRIAPRVNAAPMTRPAAPAVESRASQAPHQETHSAATAQPSIRKRSRKEMERELRAGNFDAIQPTSEVHQEQGHYTPAPEAVPVHGIKVVPTAMYDPASGKTIAGIGGGRGKNQINHLMAAAANLELERSRAGNVGKTHRANAKAKYGW
jgi:hypothetical protein